jgi:Rps23 Pro-64 3,4-dihydroxylase Tpa1-like proline 4-hydroxylase
MDITRPTFPAPLLLIDDFLHPEHADRIFEEWTSLRGAFSAAAVFGQTPNQANYDPSYRVNDVMMLDIVFANRREQSATLTLLQWRIWEQSMKNLWHEGYLIYDIINYATWREAVVSRYGDGAFYKKHQDTRWDMTCARLVTMVYYLNIEPKRFEGGELVLHAENGETLKIEPRHNRAIFFPSFLMHEVEPVKMTSTEWKDGRFSLNYWLGFMAPPPLVMPPVPEQPAAPAAPSV